MDIRAERMTRMATIEIKMLGGFEIRVNGKPVLAQLAQSRKATALVQYLVLRRGCLLYTSPSPRDRQKSRMPSSA